MQSILVDHREGKKGEYICRHEVGTQEVHSSFVSKLPQLCVTVFIAEKHTKFSNQIQRTHRLF